MPPIREEVRTKQDILDQGVEGVINYALDVSNKQRRAIIRELQSRYPNASRQSIEAAYDHVLQTRKAAREQNRLPADDIIARGSVPRNPSLPSNWQYTVEVAFTDPRTMETSYHTTVIDSQRPLSNGEITEQAIAQTRQQRRQRDRRGRRYDRNIRAEDTVVVTVLNVERR